MATHARKTFGLFTQVSGSGPLGPLVKINNIDWFKMSADTCTSSFFGIPKKK